LYWAVPGSNRGGDAGVSAVSLSPSTLVPGFFKQGDDFVEINSKNNMTETIQDRIQAGNKAYYANQMML
jgi:hypothetical protein